MTESLVKYESLSTRSSFNASVRHIKSSVSIIEGLGGKRNLASLLSERTGDSAVAGERLAALLHMTLVDKFSYASASRNLVSPTEDMAAVAKAVSGWAYVDLVLSYYHPDVGLMVLDPKDEESMGALGKLKKRELVVVYAGRFDKGSDELCGSAAKLLLDLLDGKSPKVPPALLKGTFVFKKPKVEKPKRSPKASSVKSAPRRGRKPAAAPVPAPAAVVVAAPAVRVAAAPAPGSRMTPMYSVVVQNELFHNGNVEAWKRIIESYKTAYPALTVFIYYDGERIININSLFKWGKVKHGSTIQFAVAGTDIKDVAKLQRYLIQGASPQFEAFLHGPVSSVLKLF